MQETMPRSRTGILAGIPFCLALAASPANADPTGNPAEKGASPDAAAEQAPAFDIWEYRVEGNSMLDQRVVEKTVYGFLGPGKSIGDVESARAALEKAYHDAGYSAALVDIPEQDVNEGVVILKVSEGKVDRLKVTGSRYFSLGHIKEKVPALAEGQPLNMPAAQEQLSKLSAENPDRTVTPVMRAGNTPGTVEVELAVDDQLPLHAGIEFNGRNSVDTSRTRLIASARYDNLWQLNHSASLQFQISPENTDNVQVWSGTYVMPMDIFNSDARMVFYGIGLSSKSGVSTVGALNVVGDGEIFGLRWIKPLPRLTKDLGHYATVGWDYKNFGQAILSDTGTLMTPISYSPFMAGYDASLGYEDGSFSQLNLETHVLFWGDYQEFENRRYGATPNYVYLKGDVRHRQMLPEDLSMQVRMTGQVTNVPLISNEQMGAGGMFSVRGYHEVERLGDNGVNGSLEFYSPDLGKHLYEGMGLLRFLVFGDLAYLWVKDALPDQPQHFSLASTGAGFNIELWRKLNGTLFWSYPFTRTESVAVGETRVDFRIAYDY
ncbi:ShlB/FhaC/HecB family hemolysin secretion/activation protein [Methylococcus mesophilus]|uniref:ShlB/FhaC/HecB family hemolysin secretion/activation protein n=1 Tax=Methylococcus mesophilus TaxID=2993564 RepID=UPI00224B24CD|nr:POTRA domain-containing protein [Methylococcus mesophilus]UZR28839.1 ShlB/FhaC/HecB family hemolysin secretion/activation protein [Methylococcus mesophilus]